MSLPVGMEKAGIDAIHLVPTSIYCT